MSTFLQNLLQVSLDAAPWLLFGLIVAGLIKVLIPVAWLNRWLGGKGIMPVINAALLGTPLPLCSCSVVPAALAIRRSGASRGATTSFLIATPENGADSLALSYALLGPVMMIARPIAAIVIAVATGFSVSLFVEDASDSTTPTGESAPAKSCCHSEKPKPQPEKKACCCSGGDSSCSKDKTQSMAAKLVDFKAAMWRLFDDIAFWLFIGLILAALINTFISQGQIASWGSGLPAMILMVLVGVPMYICATSSTPVAASMLIAGVSPGTVLVFLLAGPATNLGTVGIIRKELGTKTAGIYLAGVAVGSIVFGVLLDSMISQMHWGNISEQVHEHAAMLPAWLAYSSLVLLAGGMLYKVVVFGRAKLAHSAKSCCESGHQAAEPKSDCCSSTGQSDVSKTHSCCSSNHS
jgi:uncharacterized membrane protein YraQ (UPF0718 family)